MRTSLGRRRSGAGRRAAGAACLVLALVATLPVPAASAQTRPIGTVVIANGWSPADSAVASALAALESDAGSDAVVLYARAGQLTARTANFIADRRPSKVILVGGTAALSAAVQTEVERLVGRSAVSRISGQDRFDTAARAVPGNATTFIVANGYSAADVGVAAALAAVRSSAAVLLATANSLTESTEQIIHERRPAQVEFVGGAAVLAERLRDRVRELAPSVSSVPRHSGASRTDTAAAAAPAGSTTLVIANGWSPPDAGVAAAYTAVTSSAAVLYAQKSALTTPTERRIQELRPVEIVLVGGNAALSSSLHLRIHRLAPDARIRRLSGTDRIDTAARAAERRLTDVSTALPAAPTGLVASAGNQSLTVSWEAPTGTSNVGAGGLDITGYDVQYRVCRATPPTCAFSVAWTNWRAYPHSGTGTTAVLARLTNGTAYQVQVRARTGLGPGPWSAAAVGIPAANPSAASATRAGLFQFPGPPSLEAGDRKITVRWNEPVRLMPTAAGDDAAETRRRDDYEFGPPIDDGTGGVPRAPQTVTLAGYEVGYRACTAANGICRGDGAGPTPSWGSWTTRGSSGTALSTDVTGLSNGTQYEVRVRARSGGSAGPWSQAASEMPVAAPSAPPRLAADAGHRALLLTWDPPSDNGRTVIGYAVQHCDTTATGGCSGEANWTPAGGIGISADDTSARIGSLTNARNYRVRVRADNEQGSGPWAFASGRPAAVPDSPDAPGLTRGPRRLDAVWSAPGSNGSAITGYAVMYRACTARDRSCPAEHDDPAPMWGSWNTRSVSGAGTEASLTGLTNGTAYQVRVRARNANGLGPRSPAATLTPRDLPARPTGLAVEPRHQGLYVTWAKPSDGGSPFTGFDIEHCVSTSGCTSDADWQDGGFDDVADEVTDRSAARLSHAIAGLANGTRYRVRVRAETEAGVGQWSSLASGRPAAVPGAPGWRDPSATADDRSIKVAWSAADGNGSAVTGYVVGWRACTARDRTCPDGQDAPVRTWGSWSTRSVSGAGTEASLTGLTNGTAYQVRVRARNANGAGPWTLEARTATPRAAPATPADLAVGAGDQSLTVSWTNPSPDAAKPTGYQVEHRECISTPKTCASSPRWGSWTPHGDTSADTTRQITGVTNGTSYQVRVRARSDTRLSFWTPYKSAIPGVVPDRPVPVLTPRSGRIDVTWPAVARRGSSFVDYVASWRACTASDRTCLAGDPNEPDAMWGPWMARSVRGNRWSIAGLVNGTKYEVRVRARNASGVGQWSAVQSATPVGKPAKPTTPRVTPVDPEGADNRHAGGRLRVDWIPPWDNGASITGYDVQYRACTSTPSTCASSPTWATDWSSYPDAGAVTTVTLESLTNGTAYQVRVRATNAVGTGPWSTTTTGIPVGKPSAPASVDVASGNRSLILSWSVPSANGSTVTGFKVRYCVASGSCDPSAGTGWTTRTVSGASRRTYTISSLTNDTEYNVQLLTTSRSKGDSDWSTEQTVEPGGPSRPATPRLRVRNAQIVVTWTAPRQNHSAIQSYEVEHRECTGTPRTCAPTWTRASHSDTSDLEYTVTSSATAGARYEVRVRAVNAQGPGAWSPTASVTAAR